MLPVRDGRCPDVDANERRQFRCFQRANVLIYRRWAGSKQNSVKIPAELTKSQHSGGCDGAVSTYFLMCGALIVGEADRKPSPGVRHAFEKSTAEGFEP